MQTHFLTKYRIDGHSLEIQMRRKKRKYKRGEINYAGNLRRVKLIKMVVGGLKWEMKQLLWVETTWKIFSRMLKITAALWTKI